MAFEDQRVAGTPLSPSSTAGMVETIHPTGMGNFVLVCEHATSFIPPEYDGLGLSAEARQSHIAWDPGALAVARILADRLDAPLVVPGASRLLHDCNRPPAAASAIPERSEIHDIPGNRGLDAAARQARCARFYRPFHDALDTAIDARIAAGRPPVVVTIHSFVPVYHGVRRELDLGVIHDADSRLADVLLASLGADGGLRVRRNDPYGPDDGVTHTLVVQAMARRLLNVMIEIRSDLIETAAQQAAFAATLAGHLTRAAAALAADRAAGPACDPPAPQPEITPSNTGTG